MPSTITDVIEKLKQLQGPNFTEVAEKHTFECYRILEDGCMQAVTVVIFDAGPHTQGAARYFGHATSAEGRTIVSTPDSSLDAMLASMQWSDLDPDPDPEKQAEAMNMAAAAELTAGKAATQPHPEKREEFDRRDLFGLLRKGVAKKP
jgi:hypothetical protein